jgi:peptidoglycan/LPS O-acetylase OafA/YrhL
MMGWYLGRYFLAGPRPVHGHEIEVRCMSRKHYTALDGLRGVAPHRGTGWLGYLSSGGWVGVDLFFVLSGFLITGILYDTKESEHFLRNFYARRALRLFPIYFIFIAVVLLIDRGSGEHSWWLTMAYLLYGSNMVRFFLPGFRSIGMIETGHLWSLAVEEQFYMVWPWMVILLASRRRILRACLYGCAAALILRLALVHLPFASYLFIYLELPTRADALLMGAALAMLVRDPGFMARVSLPVVRIAGAAAAMGFLCMSLRLHSFFFGLAPIDTWGMSLTALASSCVLLLALQPQSWTNRMLSHRVLRFYGRYSYGIYLFHLAPAKYLVRFVLPYISAQIRSGLLAGIVYLAVVLAGSTGLAVLSFHFIEEPFLKMKRRFEGGHSLERNKNLKVAASS